MAITVGDTSGEIASLTPDLWRVDPRDLDFAWPMVASFVSRVINRTGQLTLSSVHKMVSAGEMQMWVAMTGHKVEAVALTEMIDYPAARIFRGGHLAGDGMERWLVGLDQMEKWAAEQGCTRAQVIGRKGWERALNGYHHAHVILEKELSNGV